MGDPYNASMDSNTLLNESFGFVAKRKALLDAERDLAWQREKVARLRRELPLDTTLDDYTFEDARTGVETKLTELVSNRSLIVYHLMYGKAQTQPCPMCTMWIDGFDAVYRHVAQRADFVVVAAADPAAIASHADSRGWTNIPLFSARSNTFKRDLGSENETGDQYPTISVIAARDGSLIHAYSAQPQLSDTMHERGLDLFSPVWHLLDLTAEGRSDWYPSLTY